MKKALKVIVPILLVALVIFYIVAYIVWKDQTTYITECIINFINKPLPIIGVSIAIICLFVFKCFVATRYGKKAIKDFKDENEVLKEKIEEYKENIEHYHEIVNEHIVAIDDLVRLDRKTLLKHLELSKNIKDKDLIKYLKGEQPYGEEEVDSQEETETL